jgi:hypothetical protein
MREAREAGAAPYMAGAAAACGGRAAAVRGWKKRRGESAWWRRQQEEDKVDSFFFRGTVPRWSVGEGRPYDGVDRTEAHPEVASAGSPGALDHFPL